MPDTFSSAILRQPTPDPSDAAARAAALVFTRDIAAGWAARYGAGVLGVYLIGSLAHGGFSRRYSDIDLALVMDSADAATVDTMRADLDASSPELAAKTSLFWTDRAFSTGRFPALDRIDYLDHAVALIEREHVAPARPLLEEVRGALRGAFADWGALAGHFAGLDTLTPTDGKRYLRTLLYPARFVFSWTTGGVASNDDAVAFLSDRAPPGLDVALVARALDCRHAAADPGTLFAERATLRRQVEACERVLAAA